MNEHERRSWVVIAILVAMVLVATSVVAFVVSLPEFGDATWYLRARTFEVVTPALVLGSLGYAMPRTRLTSVALRVGAAIAVLGLASEVVEFVAGLDTDYMATEAGLPVRTVSQLGDLAAYSAVVVAWWFVDRRSHAVRGLP